jgi:hypothetical protein
MSESPRVIGAAGGALGLGAFVAAAGGCCGAPWAVALLGVGGAVALARLAFLLPYALFGAAALLALAFWWAYRPPPACPEGSCAGATRRPLRMLVWMAAALVAALAALGLFSGRAESAQAGAFSYAALDDQASQLRADFNRARGSVRLLFVIDPICPTCLRGLDDLNRDLLARTSDPRLQTFVVHEPVLGRVPWLRMTASHDVSAAAALIHNPHVHHYWNASGAFGRLLADAVDLRNGEQRIYAWDVWLIYGPQASWTGGSPPRPRLLMQQLGGLTDSREFPRLDSQVFAQDVRGVLAQLPPPAATPVVAQQRPQ